MELPCSLFLLLLQVSARAAHSHKGPRGLSCLNDFVSTVSCTWDGNPPPPAPGVDCWVTGRKTTWKLMERRTQIVITRSCKLRLHGSTPGCSFAFENEFNKMESMPNISMECNGTTVDAILHYKPLHHIRLNPPGLPTVNKSTNYTRIEWSPGSPLSVYIDIQNFEVQVAQEEQMWKEAKTLFTEHRMIEVPSAQMPGRWQVRVRVRYPRSQNGQWSSWSPAASWMGADADEPRVQDRFWVKWGLLLSAGLVVLPLIIYGGCAVVSFRRLKGNPVPSPSKYFHSLHSVHKGNLKKWLNPLSASDSFFTAEALDPISPVEVCESWHVPPPTSPSSSSTSALLHFQSYSDSDTSGVGDNFSSSSSSVFYNLGYFRSPSSGSSARTDPSAAYFTYEDDLHTFHNGRNLHVSLCPTSAAPPAYEVLKWQLQTPDSGFGMGPDEEEDKSDGRSVGVGAVGTEASADPAVWNPPPPPPALPLPHPPVLAHKPSDLQAAAADGGCAAWPVSGMCRSSSMPVEPCKTGYLTLKELQTTFSNKSI
ncbi:LOW QUALITY PROTEIN: interleukin-2 receptor subunit beta [Betta splendens]|uniref:LOW QUALITY PROTEIN: interleukin-2 receptor subunit beta n=1 Tax=Betta splendens TaxID=158456 RepID=A0A6P7N4V2_BETSP|nr:LOW QUALITY PROTEIN: interleukin-2 receptor subunit beta [Betta splendens]